MSAEHARSQSSLALEEALKRPLPSRSALLDRVQLLERQIAAMDRRMVLLLWVAGAAAGLAALSTLLAVLTFTHLA